MSLKKFDDYEKGREQEALEARLQAEIDSLKTPISAPHLWKRIEAMLRKEETAARSRPEARTAAYSTRPARLLRKWFILVPASALVLIGILLALFLGLGQRGTPSGILAGDALQKIELKEREYVQAVDELEKKARPKMAAMDLEMVSLYRDKLETIDAQIRRCREALASNPANAHIRRYMLAALQDKRQTLAELLAYD
jgi:hypothetical protein